jgi:hypothetical protein
MYRQPGSGIVLAKFHSNGYVMNFALFRVMVIAIITAGSFAFLPFRGGSIRGSVTPADGGIRAWAESAIDTLKAPIINGTYEIADVRPGTYKIIIQARPPYKNVAKEGVMVSDGQTADAGEITLEK